MVELQLLGEGDAVRTVRRIGSIPLYIGRAAHKDWTVDDSRVSSAHAVFSTVQGEIKIEDLNSKNGTLVNGSRIVGTCSIHDGDIISLGGRVRLKVIGHAEDDEVSDPSAAPGRGLPPEATRVVDRLRDSDRALAGEVDLFARNMVRSVDASRWAGETLTRIASPRSRQALLEALVDATRELTGAPIAWGLTWSGDARTDTVTIEGLVTYGSAESVPTPGAISQSIVGRVVAAGAPVWSDDAHADHRFEEAASVHQMALRSVGCLPIGHSGALYLSDPEMLGRFTARDKVRLEALCRLAGRLLEQETDDAPVVEPFEEVPGLVGRSPAMGDLFRTIRAFAPMPWPVLVLGETGTGKEGVARAIHELSARGGEAVAVNCGGLDDNLAHSVLFGHERGSFTGADRRHIGYAERVGEGTLFLDEVAEMSPRTQVKLLRLIQERTFERLGGDRELTFKGRIVAATLRPIHDASTRGGFREDLFHRLAACIIHVPPLRDRRSDVPILASHLLKRALVDLPGVDLTLGEACNAALSARAWPGNVRDLENAVRRAIARCVAEGSQTLEPEHFGSPAQPQDAATTNLRAATLAFQQQMVNETLAACGNNRSEAARRLGLSRQSLYRLLDKGTPVEP